MEAMEASNSLKRGSRTGDKVDLDAQCAAWLWAECRHGLLQVISGLAAINSGLDALLVAFGVVVVGQDRSVPRRHAALSATWRSVEIVSSAPKGTSGWRPWPFVLHRQGRLGLMAHHGSGLLACLRPGVLSWSDSSPPLPEVPPRLRLGRAIASLPASPSTFPISVSPFPSLVES